MNDALIDKLAEAVLYEGYLLYPYRPSLKNTQRWTFGGLFPRAFCEAQPSVEAPLLQVECLLEGDEQTRAVASLRFLRMIDRRLGQFHEPLPDWSDGDVAQAQRVAAMTAGGREFHSWQEAADEKLALPDVTLAELLRSSRRQSFELAESVDREPVTDGDGRFVGFIERSRQRLAVSLELRAARVNDGCFRLTLRAANETEPALDANAAERPAMARDKAALRACIAAHAVIAVRGGELSRSSIRRSGFGNWPRPIKTWAYGPCSSAKLPTARPCWPPRSSSTTIRESPRKVRRHCSTPRRSTKS